jgi:hypothetical protein
MWLAPSIEHELLTGLREPHATAKWYGLLDPKGKEAKVSEPLPLNVMNGFFV